MRKPLTGRPGFAAAPALAFGGTAAGPAPWLAALETGQVIRGTLLLLLFVGIIGGLIYLTLRRAYDPAEIAGKWVITLPVLGVLLFAVLFLGVLGPFVAIACAVVLSLLWTPHLGSALASPITNLFDGGRAEFEARPLYSTAISKQKRGDLDGALREIHRQLEEFPGDAEGLMRKAEIEGQGLKNLELAERTINELLNQPGLGPKHIASALVALADMQLSVARDPAAARETLRRVVALLPNTEYSLMAERRIAHLGESVVLPHGEERRIELHHGLPREVDDPEKETAALALHLEAHPHDPEAREQLARLYAHHYQRLDLAAEQLELLITQPAGAARDVVRWLNLLADLQVLCGAPIEEVRTTLMRVVDLDPNGAAADRARARIELLPIEIRGKQKGQAVKLGTYEQNLGLKRKLTSPGHPPES